VSFEGSAYATLVTEAVRFGTQAGLIAYFTWSSRWRLAEVIPD
jgi:hypothetical protein